MEKVTIKGAYKNENVVNVDFYKNNIFYSFINGEIYQAKIKSMVFGMSERSADENGYTILRGRINDIVIEFAGLGKKQWHNGSCAYNDCYHPKEWHLYATLEDCKADKNPIFRVQDGYAQTNRLDLFLRNPIGIKLDSLAPYNGFWELNDNVGCNNTKSYYLMGYKWNGIKPIKEKYRVTENDKTNSKSVLSNIYNNAMFDIITDTWVAYSNTLYKSEQSCKEDNSVIVHTFEECVHTF